MICLKWLLFFLPAFAVELFCWATNWIACIFVRYELRTDRVKRQGNQQVTMLRAYPLKFFTKWNTHDNALDEYWHGLYDEKSDKTQDYYDSSEWFRYKNRLAWLMRNNAYGFLYAWFSTPLEPLLKQYSKGVEDKGFWYNLELYKSSFLLESTLPFFYLFGALLWGYSIALWLLQANLWYALALPVFAYLATLNQRYFSIKFGWKAHKTFPRKMYANRIPPFGIRQYK